MESALVLPEGNALLAQSSSPLWTALARALTLQDYNTRVVLAGTLILGLACGLLGVYMLLRRRALIGDAISHAALPGVVLAFLLSGDLGAEKSLGWLLLGASISGGIGGATVLALKQWAGVRDDAALGIVLSVFFGAGVALLKIAQHLPGANPAGLEGFIYGKASLITLADVRYIAWTTVVVLVVTVLFEKELRLLCFDAQLARCQGWPVGLLDGLLLAMVVVVTMVGLQAVGLILIIALLIVPAAAARFWTDRMGRMLWISAGLGGLACSIGTLLSASVEKVPSGAAIVLTACTFFGVSFAMGPKRGVVWRWWQRVKQRLAFDEQHFLRALFELLEASNTVPAHLHDLHHVAPIALPAVAAQRHWSAVRTRWLARRLEQRGLIVLQPGDEVRLTPRGMIAAARAVRNHRLLEIYLLDRAQAPVSDVDREADFLEHGLQPEHLAELSGEIATGDRPDIPPSPHELPARDEDN
ncbi:MAG: manganese ABC transporter permease [Pirellulaceae bacterium]|nr:MAG: manganese ABC transporter permease [Pirellulaceae bacterium]